MNQVPVPCSLPGVIVATARKLFELQGVRATSIAAIAREANVTRELVYYHFANRNGLIEAVIDDYVEDLVESVIVWNEARIFGDTPGSLKKCIQTFRYSLYDGAGRPRPMIAVLEELGVGFVAFSPMANGFLTGKYDAHSKFDAATDYRSIMPQFKADAVEQNQKLLRLLEELAAEKHATPAQISLAWMICKKPYIVPIPGTRKPERLRENAGAADVELTPNEVKTIDEALEHMELSQVFGGTKIVTK